MQEPDRPRRRRPAASLLACLVILVAGGRTTADHPGPMWREAPEYLRLFAPAHDAAAYRMYVSALQLDTVLARLRTDPSLLRPPGAWTPRTLSPLDAFGLTGDYNRWAVMGLYGGRPPLVARGPRGTPGAVAESWTLVSPYPDATLQRLERGTLLLVVKVAH